MAVNATFIDKMPMFGIVESIWLADDEIIFEYTLVKAVEFNTNLMAYGVENPR